MINSEVARFWMIFFFAIVQLKDIWYLKTSAETQTSEKLYGWYTSSRGFKFVTGANKFQYYNVRKPLLEKWSVDKRWVVVIFSQYDINIINMTTRLSDRLTIGVTTRDDSGCWHSWYEEMRQLGCDHTDWSDVIGMLTKINTTSGGHTLL